MIDLLRFSVNDGRLGCPPPPTPAWTPLDLVGRCCWARARGVAEGKAAKTSMVKCEIVRNVLCVLGLFNVGRVWVPTTGTSKAPSRGRAQVTPISKIIIAICTLRLRSLKTQL